MSLLKIFRKSRTGRIISIFTLFGFIEQFFFPLSAFALTGGPSQPEVQSFEPIATTQMVDPFSGDFSYNIPLFDVGGYPINISYHSGISMDQEATSVGLGWNINPGVINRHLQGIPDDFSGDRIKYKENFKPHISIGAEFEFSAMDTTETGSKTEIFGSTKFGKFINGIRQVITTSQSVVTNTDTDIDKLKFSMRMGIQYHNYRGVGYDVGFRKPVGQNWPKGVGADLDVSFSSFNGFDASAGLSYQNAVFEKTRDEAKYSGNMGLGLGIGLNSRTGIKEIGLNAFMNRSYGVLLDRKQTQSLFNVNTETYKSPGTITIHEAYRTGSDNSAVQGGMSLLSSASAFYPGNSSYTKSASYAFSYKTGMQLSGYYGYGKMSASVDWYGLDGQEIERKAVGSLYMHQLADEGDADQWVLDYNQIKNPNPGIGKNSNNIHQANQTADQFSVSGQGTGGSFKPYMGAVGTFYQPKAENKSVPSGNLDLEVGVGNYAKLGINFKYIYRKGYSGKWRNEYGNKASDSYTFSAVNGNPDQEKTYFKNIGERISVDEDYFSELGGYSPTSLQITEGKCDDCRNPINGFAVRAYVDDKLSHNPSTHTGSIVRGKRAERNQFWSHFTAEETADFGLTKYVSSYAEPHHLAEVTITGDDGRRYVYGQALYNTNQKEVSFNIDETEYDPCTHPLHEYAYSTSSAGPNTPDNTVDNKEGKDHIFSSTEIPPYAHSYYLTAVLSVDYVDVDNNGPTPNDLGDYVLFEYEKVMEDYKWRTPYTTTTNSANGYKGIESNKFDDKASYVYGEKEVWYVKTVRSKSQRAVFIYDETDRRDSYEAAGENGGRGSRTLWKLDKIEIYTEHSSNLYDPEYNPAPPSALIKTVHFAYSYDLCPNVPNNIGTATGVDHPLRPEDDQNENNGKLTLHKIWFTYQNSELGAQSPYVFEYSEENPAYDPAAVDRWGNYKPNTCSGLDNSGFPYSLQDPVTVHENAGAWHMTSITLPSGGVITVNYESDDYQFVQNRNAMQMMGIKGFGKSAAHHVPGKISDKLYEGFPGGPERRANNFVFVNLPSPVYSNEEFKEKYIRDMSEIYFKVRINLNSAFFPGDPRQEYIEGFAEIEKNDAGARQAGITTDPLVGWIELKRVGLKESHAYELNPIAKTAWQFIRMQMPYLAFPKSDMVSDPDNITISKQLTSGLIGIVPEFLNMIRGFNGKMLSERFAQETTPEKSVVRLFNPTGQKYGGGSRVASLSFSDEWDEFNATNNEAVYTTEYDYTLPEGGSSGVASYEPIIGGEENPFKKPLHYTEKPNPIGLANHLYDLEPFCEFLYPAAMVGYSRVLTRSALPSNITRHGNGYSVTEFYTAKDFPTRSSNTPLNKMLRGTGLGDPAGMLYKLASMFGASTKGVTASQGFQIILNDMHGKVKRQSTYNSETNKLVNEVSYEYKVKNEHRVNVNSSSPGTGSLVLDNELQVLNPDGSFETKPIGVDMEAYIDVNETREITHIPGLDMNFDFVQTAVPLLFQLPLPKYRRIEEYSVTASMTKVITQSGILVRTISTENGFAVETENVAFDAKTGAVLLTKTKNSFNDDVYSLTYPAHWAYDGMGQAYQNTGFEFDFEVIGGYGFANEVQGQYLCKGDEIAMPGISKRYWIFSIEKVDVSGTPMYKFGLIDAAGNIKYDDNYHGKVIRSGRRNMQSVPIGHVVSLTNPLNSGTSLFGEEADFDKVLAASAIEFDENWQTFKGFYEIGYKCVSNPACSTGRSFRENRYMLRMMAVQKLCLLPLGASHFGTVRSICEGTECPKVPFKRNMSEVSDPSKKKIPDKTDPTFDKSQTKPSSGMGGLMSKVPLVEDDGKEWAEGKTTVPNYQLPVHEYLIASTDNTFFAPFLAFPSCNQMITHVGYSENKTATPPYGMFKYKNGSTVHCAEMFTFQFPSDVGILGDEDQLSNMSLMFVSTEVVDGMDMNYYEVIFPAFPDIQAYMWSTCPDCDQNPPSGSEATPPSGSGATPIFVQPEVKPPGSSQGTLPGGENPYILGIYGNWRPKRSYIYYDTRNTYNERTQTEDISGDFNSTDIREDGVIQGFKIFWNPPTVTEALWTKPPTLGDASDPWKWNSESDQHHPNGYEIQTHDVLGIFNSAYFSPVNFQPYFVVNNSDLNNSVGENFEDYWEFYFDADCSPEGEITLLNKHNVDEELFEKLKRTSFHWNMWTSFNPYAYVKTSEAHTGHKSLYISNTTASTFNMDNQEPGRLSVEIKLPATLTPVNTEIYKPGNADLIDRFNPDNLEYFVSFWVKPGLQGGSIDFTVANAVVTPVLPLMANPVEGWYKKTYKVTFLSSPAGEALLSFKTNKDVYIDDFRMHPVNAQMKTFTYDVNYLRLSSSSDENNYATFYEYDLEGNLIRVKRETERGIYTISENRKNLKKIP